LFENEKGFGEVDVLVEAKNFDVRSRKRKHDVPTSLVSHLLSFGAFLLPFSLHINFQRKKIIRKGNKYLSELET